MKYILTLACALGFVFQVNAQKIKAEEVPVAVKNSFAKMYKANVDAEWQMRDGNYVAIFTSGGVESVGLFQADGKFLQYEWQIQNGDLPESAKSYMSANHPGKSILGSKRIKNAAGMVSYEIATADGRYFFDDKGNFTSSK